MSSLDRSLKLWRSRTNPSFTMSSCVAQRRRKKLVSLAIALFSARYPIGWTWWSQTGSNRRPHACKARALPTELWPPYSATAQARELVVQIRRLARQAGRPGDTQCVVGPGRLELPTSRLSGVCSNQLSYRPGIALRLLQLEPYDSSSLQRRAIAFPTSQPGRLSRAAGNVRKEKRRRRRPAPV
jgi:hypothetical protein